MLFCIFHVKADGHEATGKDSAKAKEKGDDPFQGQDVNPSHALSMEACFDPDEPDLPRWIKPEDSVKRSAKCQKVISLINQFTK